MSLDDAPFAPLSEEEIAGAKTPTKAAEKKPIIPVPDDAPPMQFKHPVWGAPVKTWAYRDAEGRLLFFDARFEWADQDTGAARKEVLPFTYCDIGKDKPAWRAKSMPAQRALYGVDRLAQRPDAPVVIAEGCKSADAAAELLPAHVVVTWSGGSKATGLSDWSPLAGRRVFIWPDRDRQREAGGDELPYEDQPGTITASNIVQRLKGIASEIRVLDLENWECAGGWDAADALAEGWDAARASMFIEERAIDIETAGFGVTIPFPFEYGIDGIYDGEKATSRVRVCGRLKLLAQTRDQDGSGWGLLLEWRDYDGRRHLWSMPKSMLAGDGSAVREALLERGLYVNTTSAARSKLMQFLGSVTTTVRARAVTKVGWSSRCFVLPHTTIGDTPTERVIFQHSEAPPHHYLSAGTLAEWQESVAKLAIDNSRLTFAISNAFVGPILALAAEEGGGFNLVGASSSGKTTCMSAAVSVWGPPRFMRTWRATGNGLEGIAAQHSETFLALDELGQLDPNEAGHVAYMLTNGQGKQRSSRSGQSRAVTTWNVSYLSTGEIGLADLVKQGRRERTAQAGQEVRILDIPADAGRGLGAFETLNGGAPTAEAFSRLIKTAAAEHYGVTAEAYLAAIATRRAEVEAWITAALPNFMARHSPKDADGQVLRAVRRFALVGTAGEIAIKLGILPWLPGSAFKGASEMLNAWLGRRGGTGSAEDRNIIAQFRAFFEKHGDTRFDPARATPDAINMRPALNRAGFWDLEGGERVYWVLPEAFKEIATGFDHAATVTALKSIKALRPAPNGKSSDTKRPHGMGTMKCYVIGPQIFAAPDVEDAA